MSEPLSAAAHSSSSLETSTDHRVIDRRMPRCNRAHVRVVHDAALIVRVRDLSDDESKERRKNQLGSKLCEFSSAVCSLSPLTALNLLSFPSPTPRMRSHVLWADASRETPSMRVRSNWRMSRRTYVNGTPTVLSLPKEASGKETPISWMDIWWLFTPVIEPIQPCPSKSKTANTNNQHQTKPGARALEVKQPTVQPMLMKSFSRGFAGSAWYTAVVK